MLCSHSIVIKECNQSKVCFYGDAAWKTEPVGFFQSDKHAQRGWRASPVAATMQARRPNPNLDAVDSREVELEILKKNPEVNAAKIAALLAKRVAMEALYKVVVTAAAGEANVDFHMSRRMAPTKMECLGMATQTFNDNCFSYSQYDYGMKLAASFVSMCESGVSGHAIVAAILKTCPAGSLGSILDSYMGGVY